MLTTNQSKAKAKLLPYKVGALFMEPGTGKSRVAIELVNSVPEVDYVLWVGPFQSIKNEVDGIKPELAKWGGFNCQNVRLVGIETLQSSDRTYLQIRSELEAAHCPFIIVDESLKIKNADAKRTKRLLDFSQMAEYKVILNGTPITRNLLDIYSQMEFLSPKILNMSLPEFKNTFCEYTRVTKYFGGHKSYTKEFITGYENIDYLHNLIRYYVYECDLSLSINAYYNEINYTIDDVCINEYNRLKEKYLDNEMLQWKNNNIFLEMTQKMQHVYATCENKIAAVKELFENIDESKTIIFCKYISSQEACRKHFPKATILSYQKEAYSLNMQHLNQTVYFDKVWDLALRLQSGRRTFRTGQEYDCRYWDLTGNVGLESLIDKNINKKVSMSEYLKKITKEQLKSEL